MATEKYRHILLTGSPGCGKTTLVMKICRHLKNRAFPHDGFYTKEVREGRERQGFDVVTLDGKQLVLARVREHMPAHKRSSCPTVGKYLVDVGSFDEAVNEVLNVKQNEKQIYVVDEIGKMELFSHNFAKVVSLLFSLESATVFGTLPLPKGKPLKLVDDLRKRQDTKIFEVTKSNRDSLEEEVLKYVIDAFST